MQGALFPTSPRAAVANCTNPVCPAFPASLHPHPGETGTALQEGWAAHVRQQRCSRLAKMQKVPRQRAPGMCGTKALKFLCEPQRVKGWPRPRSTSFMHM